MNASPAPPPASRRPASRRPAAAPGGGVDGRRRAIAVGGGALGLAAVLAVLALLSAWPGTSRAQDESPSAASAGATGALEDGAPTSAPAPDVALAAPAARPIPPPGRNGGRGQYVYHIRINTDLATGDMIDRHHHYLIHRKLLEAEAAGARAFLLEINTNGGLLDAAMMINDRLLKLSPDRLRTITWVNTRALSAGAMIALSTDHIVVTPGANIGAALPVTTSGGEAGGGGAPAAKIIAAVAKQMKAAAEAKGHPGDVAVAMVDPNHPLAGYSEEGELLSLTSREAIATGLAEAHVTSVAEILRLYDLEGATVVEPRLTVLETVAAQLSRTVVTSLLLAVAFIALIVEVKSPGIGLPLGVSAICFGLAMFGGYMADLAGLLEPLLLILGLGLIAVEVFVLPGFGIAGISGIVCVVAALVFSMNNIPDSAWGILTLWLAPTVYAILGAMIGTVVGLPIVLRILPSLPFFGGLMMEEEPTAEEMAPTVAVEDARIRLKPGMLGVAETACRPAGIARFGDERFDVVTDGIFIDKGEYLVLRKIEGNKVVVLPKPLNSI